MTRLASLVMTLSISLYGINPGEAASSLSVERNQAVQNSRRQNSSQSLSRASPEVAPAIVLRKQRIERVLLTLDRVASITQTMKPENASRIEPVVVDLAEQAIDLASDRALQSPATDNTLKRLEETTQQLVYTVGRMVEPEATL